MEVLKNDFTEIDFEKYAKFIKNGEDKEMLLETLITASIIHLNISLKDFFNGSNLSFILQDLLKEENYIGIINQVKLVINYYFGEKLYKCTINKCVVEKIKWISHKLYSQFHGSSDKFNEMQPSKVDVIVDLELLIHEHFPIKVCENSTANTTVGYINNSASLPVNLHPSGVPWKTKKIWAKPKSKVVFKKLVLKKEQEFENSYLAIVLNENYKWTLDTFTNYCKRRIKGDITIRDDLKIVCNEDDVKDVNAIIREEYKRITKLILSEVAVIPHPKYALDVVVGAGFETKNILRKNEFHAAYLTITNSDYIFHDLNYKIVLEKIKASFGSVNNLNFSSLNETDMSVSSKTKIDVGFVTFLEPVDLKKITTFEFKGLTLRPEKSLPLIETMKKFKEKFKSKLFTFNDKTFTIQSEYFNYLKFPLKRFVDRLNANPDLMTEIAKVSDDGKISINRTKESEFTYKEIYEKIFNFMQPYRLKFKKMLYPNFFIKKRLEKNVSKMFKIYAKAHGTDWTAYGSERNVSKAYDYLAKYQSGEIETYENLFQFESKSSLRSAIFSHGHILSEFREVYVDWKSLTLFGSCYNSNDGRKDNFVNKLKDELKIKERMNTTDENVETVKIDKKNKCSICWGEYEESSDIKIFASTKVCSECFKRYLSTQRDQDPNVLRNISNSSGGQLLPIKYILLKAEDADLNVMIEKSFNRFLIRVNKNRLIKLCPAKDCRFGPVLLSNMTCLKCMKTICSVCGDVSHPGKNCEKDSTVSLRAEYKKWGSSLKLLPYRYCPCCNYAVERNGGCRCVNCYSCLTYFCWDCIEFYNDDMMKVLNHRCLSKFSFK